MTLADRVRQLRRHVSAAWRPRVDALEREVAALEAEVMVLRRRAKDARDP